MIPVMMRFWMPHGVGGGGGEGPDYECEFATNYRDDFDGTGTIDGTSPEVSPNDSWTYTSASATKSDGMVSPAIFSASGDQIAFLSGYIQAWLAPSETLSMRFYGESATSVLVELAFGAGEACTFEFDDADPEFPDNVSDTFSIGASSEAAFVTVYVVFVDTTTMDLYVGPDFTTPAVTLTYNLNSFPSYLQCGSFEFDCTGNNTEIAYIRICGDQG
jgi:hypothetical protein